MTPTVDAGVLIRSGQCTRGCLLAPVDETTPPRCRCRCAGQFHGRQRKSA